MPELIKARSATSVWLDALHNTLLYGSEVQPRGQETLEVIHRTVRIDMSRPVVSVPARKLNYTFMAAECLWIISGDNRVASIAPYNKNIAAFSDDGEIFAGAYGPEIASQLSYVVNKLLDDVDTRQAVLTIWKKNPPPSKDIPCTVSIAFTIRRDALNVHVLMRSSDLWLGLPYDTFNFAMLGAKVACTYNVTRPKARAAIGLGTLYLSAISSHLYKRDIQGAQECLEKHSPLHPQSEPLPLHLVVNGRWGAIEEAIRACRDKQENADWRVRPA